MGEIKIVAILTGYLELWYIGLDKSEYQVNSFLITGQKHMLWVLIRSASLRCFWYSLEVPRRGASNEYPQHMFSLRNKKIINTFWRKKVPYQELCDIQQNLKSRYPTDAKYLDTLSTYHTCPKIWNGPFYHLLTCLKYCCMYGKQCRPWSNATFCGIWSGSTLFANA